MFTGFVNRDIHSIYLGASIAIASSMPSSCKHRYEDCYCKVFAKGGGMGAGWGYLYGYISHNIYSLNQDNILL